jgi:hypothetical protein
MRCIGPILRISRAFSFEWVLGYLGLAPIVFVVGSWRLIENILAYRYEFHLQSWAISILKSFDMDHVGMMEI